MADPKVKVDAIVDDTQAVQQLGKTLRNLQQAAEALSKSMTTAATAGAKYDAAMSKAALANEKLAQASARTALAQQKVATEAERTAAAHLRVVAAEGRAAKSAGRLGGEMTNVARLTAMGERELEKYERQLARTATEQAELSDSFAGAKERINQIGDVIKNVVAAATAVGAVLKKTFDLAKEGAEIEQAGVSFDNFARNIAKMPDLLEQMREASQGTISDMQLMQSTLTLVTGTTEEAGAALARNAPQLLEIARAAQILNPALGDMDFFFHSLSTGIKRLEPRLIDNLGLVLKARDAYATHARMLGISTQALTAEQKSQAFLNEVLRVGNLLIEQNAGSVNSAVDPFYKLDTGVEKLTNSFKVFLANGLVPYINLINGEFVAANAAIAQVNDGAILSIGELAAAYEKAQEQQQLFYALVPFGLQHFLVDIDQVVADVELLEQEMARAAGSFEEFARATGNVGYNTAGQEFIFNEEELRMQYERLIVGIQGAAKAQDFQKVSLDNYLSTQQEHIDLTDEQAEALAKLKEQWADAAVATLKNAGSLNEFATGLLSAADGANLTAGQIFRLAGAMGILSDEELEAAQNAHAFQQEQSRLIGLLASGQITTAQFAQQIQLAARRLGIDYQTAAQKSAQATQLLTAAANMGLGSVVRFGQGLGVAALQALKLKKANDAATQSVQRLATVSSGAASAFINALEGGTSGGGGGTSAIDAAVQAQQEWNAAFAQSFMQLLDAEEPIENWNTELLKSAAAAGASAETLALLAAATGEYSEEQIRTALHGAAMKNAIEEIAAALADGRATTDEALAAVAGFQEQLAQGGDFKFNVEDFGIEPLQEAIAGAGGGAGGAAEQTMNWTAELLKLADQGNLTTGDLVILAGATGDYTDAQIQAALKTLFMTQKLEELAKQIGKRPIQDIISDLQQFEADLDKQFELQFSTGDAEESIRRVRGGLDEIPREITVNIKIKADPIPDLGPGVANPLAPGSAAATQQGGPLARAQHGLGLPGTTLVGEVRPELVVGGQVIPRIPPGFFMDQGGFAESVAAALSGSMVAPPSYNNTTNINRSNTVNNNQRNVVINNSTGAAASQTTRRELGAF